MLGAKQRRKISDKYEAESMRRGDGVEVFRPGLVAVANSSGDVCEPFPLYVGSDRATKTHNAGMIDHAEELAVAAGGWLLFRPRLGLEENEDAARAMAGEDVRQRLARKSKARARRWSFRTKGNVSHISTAKKKL